MSFKINDYIIKKMKINGNYISEAKINGNKVFDSNQSCKLSYSNYVYSFTADEDGVYQLRYVNENKILNNYEAIGEVIGKSGSFTGLINLNAAPKDATRVALVKDNVIKTSLKIPNDFEQIADAPLYSVGLISDTHIDGDGTDTADSINDLKLALALFKNQNVSFIAHCGDVAEDGRSYDYTAYANAVADNTIPIRAISGNHDLYSTLETVTGQGLYHEYLKDNDVYLFVGSYTYNTTNPFSTEELEWLENKLEEYKNQRVFLFCHYYCDPVGDANKLDSDSLTTSGQAQKFRNLLNTYKDNVIYFSGHSHFTYKMQKLVSNANISLATNTMPRRVHIPSNGRPRILKDGSVTNDYVGAECGIMDVYSDSIVIRGYNLKANKMIPLAIYKFSF